MFFLNVPFLMLNCFSPDQETYTCRFNLLFLMFNLIEGFISLLCLYCFREKTALVLKSFRDRPDNFSVILDLWRTVRKHWLLLEGYRIAYWTRLLFLPIVPQRFLWLSHRPWLCWRFQIYYRWIPFLLGYRVLNIPLSSTTQVCRNCLIRRPLNKTFQLLRQFRLIYLLPVCLLIVLFFSFWANFSYSSSIVFLSGLRQLTRCGYFKASFVHSFTGNRCYLYFWSLYRLKAVCVRREVLFVRLSRSILIRLVWLRAIWA